MCNDYRLEVDVASIMEDFDDLKIKIRLPEGTPNVAAREDIMITDVAPIVKGVAGERSTGELVNRRWSWPGPSGKPVFNYRSEGRPFKSRRCLVLCDGFYETTDPMIPKQKRLDKWLFTLKDHRWFAMAGYWQEHEAVGEAFTLLTMDAGADIRPYHDRQIIPLTRDLWADWLDPNVPAAEVLRHLPAGSLIATKVWPPQDDGPQQGNLLLGR